MRIGKLAAIIIGALVLLVIVFWGVLAFGSPQWHWRIYSYQLGVAGGETLNPDENYSGIWNNWDSSGKLRSWYTYKDGKRDGKYEVLNSEEGMTSTGQYVNGELDGIQTIYPGNGVRAELPYVNGKRHGVETSWFSDGTVAVEAPWVDGLQDGVVISYYPDGTRQAAIPFYQGKREGVYYTWYEDGQKEGEQQYRNDMKNGRSIFWQPDGKESIILNYRDDKLEGLQVWFHPNGKKYKELTMKNEMLHGHYREWDEEGNLVVDELHEDGVLKEDADGTTEVDVGHAH